jgi:hypothetical protein
LEQNMAPKGNETLWMRDLMDAATKHAGFAMTSQNTAEPRPTRLLPKFPYQEAGLYFSGKAFFHQFGRFVADLENRFPYVRLEGLMLTPLAANTPTSDQDRAGGLSTPTEDSYKLEFTVWVVALIRPE